MMATSNPFSVFNTIGETENVTSTTGLSPSIRAGLLSNQTLRADFYTHKLDTTISSIQHDIDRANVLHGRGHLSNAELAEITQKSENAKEKFTSVRLRAGVDQQRLGALEMEHMDALAGGDHLRSETERTVERNLQKKIDDNNNALQKIMDQQQTIEEETDKVFADNVKVLETLELTGKASDEAEEKFRFGEITAAERNAAVDKNAQIFKRAQQLKTDARIAATKVQSIEETVAKGLEVFKVAEEGFTALRTFDRSIGPINVAIRTTTNAIGAYTDPLVNLAKDLGKVKDILGTAYDKYALASIEGASNSKYLAQINKITEEEIQELGLSDTMKEQLKAIEKIRETAGGAGTEMTEALIAEASKWMGPSFRMVAVLKAQAWDLGAAFKYNPLLEVFLLRPMGALKLALEGLFDLPRILIYKLLERSVGVVTTEAIIETTAAAARYTIAQAASHLAPEVQAIMLLGYMVWDIKNVHHFEQWLGDQIKFITCGLVSIDRLEMSGYREFSSPGTVGVGEGPEKMWKIDHDELKTSIDFWGKHFVEMNAALHDHAKPSFKSMNNFKGVTRRVGRYIDPKHFPYDSQAEIDACVELEKSLDLGTIVDENGDLTGVDKGGQLVNSLLPRKKGLVRNLVNFPLYKSTITWPDRDGVFTQTEGQFSPYNIDKGIATTFLSWIKTGRWGPAFTDPKATVRTKMVAIDRNIADYNAWMKPEIKDPYAWVDAQDWAKGNVGKRAILRQEMHGVTLEVIMLETVTDFPVNPDSSWIHVYNESAHQDTMDFVENMFRTMGRYPVTPNSQKFYNNVIKNKKTRYVEVITGPTGIMQLVSERDSTAAEIRLYTTATNQIQQYVDALNSTMESTEKAWDTVMKQTLWDAFVADTSPRTDWGYITKIKSLLLIELESQVSLMAGKQRNKLYEEFTSIIGKAGVPLNTNRFGRVAFTARMNQLLFSTEEDSRKEIEKTSGKILKDILITTAMNPGKIGGFIWKEIRHLGSDTLDLPVLFGDVHCRIIVVEKPRHTCFVVFKETKKFWEWTIEADFTGAEFASVIPGKDKGSFKLVTKSKQSAIATGIKALYEDSEVFTLHRGFLRVWKAFQPEVEKALMDIYKTIGVADVIVTGHGMGAAVAQVACFEIPSNPVAKHTTASSLNLISGLKPTPVLDYKRPHAYLFASPPVGDQKFGWHFNNITSESAQIYIDGDVATMIPPFLIPSATYAGMKGVTTMDQVLQLGDATQLRGTWGLLNRIYKNSNLPYFDLRMFAGRDGTVDWKKVAGFGVSMAQTLTQHKAIRGGGVFMVLSYTDSGHVDEFHTDPGSSRGSLDALTHAIVDDITVRKRHDLDLIVEKLKRVARENPDLFTDIKENEAKWDETAEIHDTNVFPKPPTLTAVHPQGKVVGFATTKKRHHPGSQITLDDIHENSIVLFPDVDELNRVHRQQQRRVKIRKKTEGDYHGY